MFWYILAIIALVPWVRLLVHGRSAMEHIPPMEKLIVKSRGEVEELPTLSVVIAARDEEAKLEDCLRSLAAQDHPNLEIIVVNDRSTDGTGAILERVGREFLEKIRSLSVWKLPEGWLGKCNAQQQGAELATGEYILFTDADVEFSPGVMSASHVYMRGEDADQLAVIPETTVASFLERAMMNVFAVCFFIGFPPHRAMVRNSGKYVGIGAFNMVSARMYKKIQGHKFLRLQIVDDVGLGRLVKFSGGIVRVAWGKDHVKVRWQDNLGMMIRGLEKNFFAAANYSLVRIVMMTIGLVIFTLWPWVGVWVGPTAARVLCGVVLAMQVVAAAATAVQSRFSVVHGLTVPAGVVLLLTAMWRSTIVTLRSGGVRWRDTFYPLKDLKQFRL